MTSSAALLNALEQAGVLFPEDAARIRAEHPNPFARSGVGVSVTLEKPVLFSSQALVAWFEAGLLDRWLRGEPGWPPQLIVGPVGWQLINQKVSEGEIYREALQLATNLRENVEDMIASGRVAEVLPVDPPDVGGDPGFRELLMPTLGLLAQAHAQKLTLWTDDFCPHSIMDTQGPLLQEQPFLDLARGIRRAFSSVTLSKTEDILRWLESAGQLSRDRRMTLLWQLHQAGYRFLAVGEVLPWLLQRFHYNSSAKPVASLLRDLEVVSTLNLPHVIPQRLRAFGDWYVSAVLSQAVAELWKLEDVLFTNERRAALSTEIASLFEKITAGEPTRGIQQFFWHRLIHLRWLGDEQQPWMDASREAVLERFVDWVAKFILADVDRRRAILRQVEYLALVSLRFLRTALSQPDEGGLERFGILMMSLLDPLFSTELLGEFDPLFPRLASYVAGFDTGLREPVERQACGLLARILAGQQPPEVKYLFPFEIVILPEISQSGDSSIPPTSDSQPFYLAIPLLLLPLTADAALRERLFLHFQMQFAWVEPSLAESIRQLLPELTAEDSTIAQRALRKFYCAYLLSFHFQFVRDPRRGFEFLANCALGELEEFCGGLSPWPKGMSLLDLFHMQSREGVKFSEESSQSQQLALSILLPPVWFARLSEQILQEQPREHHFQQVTQWAQQAEASSDVLDSFRWLAALLHVAHRVPAMKIRLGEGERSLREWLTEHLLKVIRYKPREHALSTLGQDNVSSADIPIDSEFLRRSIHAKVLRLAFHAVASPKHLHALDEKSSQLHEREIVGELMMRGVVVAHRLLPVLLSHTRIPIKEIDERLSEGLRPETSPWASLSFRDQFNPELYGPGPDQCDLVVLGTLAVFQELGLGIPSQEGTSTSSFSAPFWLTPSVRRALAALASRPENAAEQRIREAREQEVPNRLQTFLNRTPQEYAATLLRMASSKHLRAESLLMQGQEKLREIFQQIADSVSFTPEPPVNDSTQLDMLVTLTLKGEEKRIAVEVKLSAEPRSLRHVIERLKNCVARSVASYGLLFVPEISERSRKICEDSNVGYVDMQGNAFVKFEGVFLKTTTPNKSARKRGRTKSVFAPVSTRVIRVLLAEPQRRWKLKDLAEVAHLSLGQTHKVKQALLDQEFIEVDQGKGVFLKDASALLNAWQQTYSFEKNPVVPLKSGHIC